MNVIIKIMFNIRQFNPTSVAVATTTSYPKWYRGKLRSNKHTDKIRGDLALEMIRIATKKGYKVIIADWNSPRKLRKELSLISGAVIIRRRSPRRSIAKRQALRMAAELPTTLVIILTEPEKVSLIEDCMDRMIMPILKGEADIVIPKRNDELFKKTYPDYQYLSEKEGNNIYNEELKSHKLIKVGEDLDMFFGPRVFLNKRPILSLFLKRYEFNIKQMLFPKWYFDPEELSNTNFFPVVEALKKGFKVKTIEVPFKYPNLQRQNEENGLREIFFEKRKAQRIGLIIELLHFVAFLEKYRGVRLKAT